VSGLIELEPSEPEPEPAPPGQGGPLLAVDDLQVTFPTEEGAVRAVRGVDLAVHPGETLGIVGESGSGKSVTVLAVMGLLPKSAVVEGSARYRGDELLGRRGQIRRYRGGRLAMIFQDPLTALNPVQRVGDQIAEAVAAHQPSVGRDGARSRAAEMLELVGIPQPRTRARQYPHEYSGGMRQRAMIAMAIANDPDVLIADEPTTALDVTVQAQILEVLQDVQRETEAAVVFITHDLGVIARLATRVHVMYAGKVVEAGAVDDIFAGPRHPYTAGLLASIPRIDAEDERLRPIPGAPPSMLAPPSGCAFHPRCPMAQPLCSAEVPALRFIEGTQSSACHFAEEVGAG
jgi:oligopeptide/dipeptide ABC transporter ATP-binding protein